MNQRATLRVRRILSKKGVEVMLVSHMISDFDPAMRSYMNLSVFFRSKYEGDLEAISKILGSEFSKVAPSLPVGYSRTLAEHLNFIPTIVRRYVENTSSQMWADSA